MEATVAMEATAVDTAATAVVDTEATVVTAVVSAQSKIKRNNTNMQVSLR